MTRPPRVQLHRHEVAPPPADDPGDPRLVELLRAEIDASGPITFARFMQRALYEPELGYYATSRERPTRGGDFLTAPELHPVFGHALARQVEEMWRRLDEPEEFVLREHGAGRGTLGMSIEEGLARMASPLSSQLHYEPLDTGSPAAGTLVGCVLANELLDALPVHRVVQRRGALHEIYVGWRAGRFVDVEGELSSPRLAAWFDAAGVTLEEGQRAEVGLAAADWLAEVAQRLARGYVLILDYADEPAALYGSARSDGTLRAFREHHLSRDVLAGVGRQDITATVDLGALERAARDANLAHLGTTTQAEFLVGCGLEHALEEERNRVGEDWQARALLRAAVARLLDPRQLGGYRVVVYGRGVPVEPPLRGLAYRLPSR